jgi:7-cyano-7-deazaguanine synthase
MTNSTPSSKAVVLLSGGLDSATVLAVAQSEGFKIHAISFSYGQRHSIEVDAAKRVSKSMGVASHTIVEIDLRPIGGSALTSETPVPKDRNHAEMNAAIPVTYVPARNTIFLSYALAIAEVRGATDIFIGVSSVDYSGYPDCRPEYVEAFERLANLATATGVTGERRIRIRAPLILTSKADTIRRGIALGVDYSLTHSCYDPDLRGRACGRFDSCQLRHRGFVDAGIEDPTLYAMETVG